METDVLLSHSSECEGIDHVPENKGWYGNHRYRSLKEAAANMEKPMLSRCKWKADNSEWVIDRVGPIKSTGGNDWWQLGWPDVGGLSEVLMGGNGVGIIGNYHYHASPPHDRKGVALTLTLTAHRREFHNGCRSEWFTPRSSADTLASCACHPNPWSEIKNERGN